MAAREILNDLFFIERGYLNANHFVFRSQAPVLIDTGYIGNLDQTRQLIADLGVAPAEVRKVLD